MNKIELMEDGLLDERGNPRLDERGHEVLDDTPVSIPLRFKRVPDMMENMRKMIREEMSRAADAMGYESFEDADDFDVGDDYDPRSPYELDEDMLEYDHTRDVRGPDGGSENAGNVDPGETQAVQPNGKGTKTSRTRPKSDKQPDSHSDGGSGDGEEK